MANPWFRLWTDMVNDPKWRTIARKSGQRIGDVIAVAIHMMTNASSAECRGELEGWSDEDVATALDLDTEHVTAIRDEMQGRFLDGDRLRAWEKRQPKRERDDDSSNERVKAFREKQRHVTPCNANENQETPREDKSREDKEQGKSKDLSSASLPTDPPNPPDAKAKGGTRLPDDWVLPMAWGDWALKERPGWSADDVRLAAEKFRDHWHANANRKEGRKADWLATWRNWVRNSRGAPNARASPVKQSAFDQTMAAAGRAKEMIFGGGDEAR